MTRDCRLMVERAARRTSDRDVAASAARCGRIGAARSPTTPAAATTRCAKWLQRARSAVRPRASGFRRSRPWNEGKTGYATALKHSREASSSSDGRAARAAREQLLARRRDHRSGRTIAALDDRTQPLEGPPAVRLHVPAVRRSRRARCTRTTSCPSGSNADAWRGTSANLIIRLRARVTARSTARATPSSRSCGDSPIGSARSTTPAARGRGAS